MTNNRTRAQVYTGGRIVTCDPEMPRAESIGIVAGRIAAVGPADHVLAALPGAEVIDVDGRAIIPGLADCHVHLAGQALEDLTVQCRDFHDASIRGVGDILDRMRTAAASAPEGGWVLGTGSPMQELRLDEGRLPTLEEFDAAVPGRPAYLAFGAHVGLANSVALREKGISRSTPDPAGGRIERDPRTGEPNGILLERARFLIQRSLTQHYSLSDMEDSMEAAVHKCLARGVTTIHDILKYRDEITAWQDLYRAGRLPLRVMILVRAIESDFDVTAMPSLGLTAGFGDDHLWFGGAKISIDGGFSSGSAAFHHDVSSHVGHGSIIRIDQAELDETVKLYHDSGIRVCVHAIGDRAADMALSAFAAAGKPRPELRHRVEHLGNFLFTPERRRRTEALGLTPVPNASFLYFLGRGAWDLLGGGSDASGAFPFRTMLEEGFHVATGADGTGYWPVDTLRDMAAMMERESFDGVAFSSGERLTAEQALYCQTVNAAWLGYREDRLGSLTPGKLADFAVLDCADFAALPAKDMRAVTVNRTVIGGEVAFDQAIDGQPAAA